MFTSPNCNIPLDRLRGATELYWLCPEVKPNNRNRGSSQSRSLDIGDQNGCTLTTKHTKNAKGCAQSNFNYE